MIKKCRYCGTFFDPQEGMLCDCDVINCEHTQIVTTGAQAYSLDDFLDDVEAIAKGEDMDPLAVDVMCELCGLKGTVFVTHHVSEPVWHQT